MAPRDAAPTPPVDEDATPLEQLIPLLKRQRRRWRVWFGGVTLVVLVVGLIAVDARSAARDANAAAEKAQTALDLVIAQRTESRLNTCLKDRKFAKAHNSLVYALAHSDPTRTATEQAAVDEQAVPHYVEVPDCSPEGIAAFYAGQGGTNPAVFPSTSTTTTTAPPPTTAIKPRRSTTSTARPSTSTSHATTTTTFRSSPTTTATPCTGITLPGGLPCL